MGTGPGATGTGTGATGTEAETRAETETAAGTLEVFLHPAAELWIDGQRAGVAHPPKSLGGGGQALRTVRVALRPGVHRVRAVLGKRASSEQQVQVRSGQTVQLKIDLARRR